MSTDHPHRRRNPLTGEWVLVSPQRMKRPWQGERKPAARKQAVAHDPGCYLCAGNTRSGGHTNPDYSGTYTFANDFPALLEESQGTAGDGLLREHPVAGEARVICYSPDHSATLATMPEAGRREVVETWCALSAQLGARWANVQLFENKGAMMGASSPHPHGQVWASDFVPTLVQREDDCQRAHFTEAASDLLGDVMALEIAAQERIVAANSGWIALVPHWAAWPFELLLVARCNAARLEELDEGARADLSDILGQILPAYDALFDTSFPYSMGWHGAPHSIGSDTQHWRLHAHFYPPLLRSAEIRKHMVGYELLAETQRDLTPEAAAQRLRECLP